MSPQRKSVLLKKTRGGIQGRQQRNNDCCKTQLVVKRADFNRGVTKNLEAWEQSEKHKQTKPGGVGGGVQKNGGQTHIIPGGNFTHWKRVQAPRAKKDRVLGKEARGKESSTIAGGEQGGKNRPTSIFGTSQPNTKRAKGQKRGPPPLLVQMGQGGIISRRGKNRGNNG